MLTRYSLAACCLLICWAGAACQPESKLPPDPGLAGDTYGVGVSLGMDLASAQQAVAQAGNACEIWLLAPDELATRAPYSERPREKDLVVALHMPLPAHATEATEEVDGITEIRCYIAPAEASKVRLLGKPVAPLTPEDVTAWLGEPVDRTDGNDGRTHLTYYFAPQQQGNPGVKLVTSHDLDGSCFAFAVSYAEQLPR